MSDLTIIKFFKSVFSIILTYLLLCGLSIQAQTTMGKEFWLTFGQRGASIHTQTDLQIRIVNGSASATATIHFTHLGTPFTHTMNAYEVYTYTLNNTEKQAVYNMTSGSINNYSIHITSTELVSVYTMNSFANMGDATNIFPVTALQNEYYHISYRGYLWGMLMQ